MNAEAPPTVTVYYPRALRGDGGVVNALWLWVESLEAAGAAVEVRTDPALRALPFRTEGLETRVRGVRHVGRARWRVPTGEVVDGVHPTSVLLLHSGYVAFNLVAAFRARRRNIPYVVMPHGAYDPQVRATRGLQRRVWEVAERRMLERALAVHVFFPAERAHVADVAPRARTTVAPTAYAVPAETWQPDEAEPYVLWLGRFDIRHKGLDRLLDAMALLPADERPHLRLHGRPSKDDADAVRRLVDGLELGDDVVVGPPVGGERKRRLILGARAVVHPSRWESYGVALVEALAYGVPCLTTRDIALGDLLAEHRAAHVVDGRVEALAEGLRSAAAGELAAYGARGRRFVQTQLGHAAAGGELLVQLAEARADRTA